jgi:antitoxin component of RelBE/YafQ-DinJ toxin-antitoxin module
MTNITMSVDETLLQQARKVALERGTSLSGMVREFLTEITQRDEEKKQIAVRELKKIFKQNSIDLSTKNWSREDLYER